MYWFILLCVCCSTEERNVLEDNDNTISNNNILVVITITAIWKWVLFCTVLCLKAALVYCKDWIHKLQNTHTHAHVHTHTHTYMHARVHTHTHTHFLLLQNSRVFNHAGCWFIPFPTRTPTSEWHAMQPLVWVCWSLPWFTPSSSQRCRGPRERWAPASSLPPSSWRTHQSRSEIR